MQPVNLSILDTCGLTDKSRVYILWQIDECVKNGTPMMQEITEYWEELNKLLAPNIVEIRKARAESATIPQGQPGSKQYVLAEMKCLAVICKFLCERRK